MTKLQVALVGYGYWGPKLLNNLLKHPRVKVESICDISQEQLKKARIALPHIKLTDSFLEIINNKNIDCVIIATPTKHHFQLSHEALLLGKHVLVEKPMTETLEDATKLVNLAEKKGVIICVDHPYVLSSPVQKIKSLLIKNHLGQLYYYKSERSNLGKLDDSANVFTDLLPHDLAILDYLMDQEEPEEVIATGSAHVLNKHIENGTVFLKYKNGFVANIYLSWHSPIKVRHITIAGSKKMLIYDDEHEHKIRIFDSGIDIITSEHKSGRLINYRNGRVTTPKLNNQEPLYRIIDSFVQAVLHNKPTSISGNLGLRVVKTLERINNSIKLSNLI